MLPSDASRKGRGFVAANGDRIPNLGEVTLNLLMAGDTKLKVCSKFQVANVSRPLYSVSKIAESGCDVTFGKTQATIRRDGAVLAVFHRQGGLYIGKMKLNLSNHTKGTDEPFPRPDNA